MPTKLATLESTRKGILDQILQPEAADRLGRIRLVKPARATEVENKLIMLAQTGQLKCKVAESHLKELLEAVSEAKDNNSIIFRRKGWDSDED